MRERKKETSLVILNLTSCKRSLLLTSWNTFFSAPVAIALDKWLMLEAEDMSSLYFSARNFLTC